MVCATNGRPSRNALALSIGSVAILLLLCGYYFGSAAVACAAIALFGCAVMVRYKSLQKIGLILVATFFALSAAEVAASFLVPKNKKQSMFIRNADYPEKYSKRTDLGMLGNAGVYKVQKVSMKGDEIYNVKYSIGDDGFRITSPQKQAGFRVNFFGCSLTFGEGLNDDETLPHFVNHELQAVYVKNFGFHGWGAHNALALLQSSRDTGGSVNFFITMPWHVYRSACKQDWVEYDPKYRLTHDHKLIQRGICKRRKTTMSMLLAYSKIYNVFEKFQKNRMTSEDVDLYFAMIRAMAEISHSRDQKFIVGYIKTDRDSFGGSGLSNDFFYSKLAEVADDIVDLTLGDSEETVDRRFFIPLDLHPTVLANRERAKLVAEVIRKHLQ